MFERKVVWVRFWRRPSFMGLFSALLIISMLMIKTLTYIGLTILVIYAICFITEPLCNWYKEFMFSGRTVYIVDAKTKEVVDVYDSTLDLLKAFNNGEGLRTWSEGENSSLKDNCKIADGKTIWYLSEDINSRQQPLIIMYETDFIRLHK